MTDEYVEREAAFVSRQLERAERALAHGDGDTLYDAEHQLRKRMATFPDAYGQAKQLVDAYELDLARGICGSKPVWDALPELRRLYNLAEKRGTENNREILALISDAERNLQAIDEAS